jgi:thiamine-phosphate diphosphorylase
LSKFDFKTARFGSQHDMGKPTVDYTLYLVTDSTPAILGDKDIVQVVEAALKGGVTCVQYREKHADTGEMIATANRLHEVTKKYKVPLLINDRIDVALAVGCEGVHIGQDDVGKCVCDAVATNKGDRGTLIASISAVYKTRSDWMTQ